MTAQTELLCEVCNSRLLAYPLEMEIWAMEYVCPCCDYHIPPVSDCACCDPMLLQFEVMPVAEERDVKKEINELTGMVEKLHKDMLKKQKAASSPGLISGLFGVMCLAVIASLGLAVIAAGAALACRVFVHISAWLVGVGF